MENTFEAEAFEAEAGISLNNNQPSIELSYEESTLISVPVEQVPVEQSDISEDSLSISPPYVSSYSNVSSFTASNGEGSENSEVAFNLPDAAVNLSSSPDEEKQEEVAALIVEEAIAEQVDSVDLYNSSEDEQLEGKEKPKESKSLLSTLGSFFSSSKDQDNEALSSPQNSSNIEEIPSSPPSIPRSSSSSNAKLEELQLIKKKKLEALKKMTDTRRKLWQIERDGFIPPHIKIISAQKNLRLRIALDILKNTAEGLEQSGYASEAAALDKMHKDVESQYDNFNSNDNAVLFQTEALAAIEAQLPKLNRVDSFQIVKNLAVAVVITAAVAAAIVFGGGLPLLGFAAVSFAAVAAAGGIGLGAVVIPACVKKAVTGNFMFFGKPDTDVSTVVDRLKSSIKALNPDDPKGKEEVESRARPPRPSSLSAGSGLNGF